eukprot:6888628-Pyramimonas_sp.AAC.1
MYIFIFIHSHRWLRCLSEISLAAKSSARNSFIKLEAMSMLAAVVRPPPYATASVANGLTKALA